MLVVTVNGSDNNTRYTQLSYSCCLSIKFRVYKNNAAVYAWNFKLAWTPITHNKLVSLADRYLSGLPEDMFSAFCFFWYFKKIQVG